MISKRRYHCGFVALQLSDYFASGETKIEFTLTSCDNSRADYYDAVRVRNGKLVLESNTVGHIHGPGTQTYTVCTVTRTSGGATEHKEFRVYTVSDRTPRPLSPNEVNVEAVRAKEIDIGITAPGSRNYFRVGWRKKGGIGPLTFGVVSFANSPAVVTIPGLEAEADYEIRVYLITRQAFDLYRGGNSGSTGDLIPDITPSGKWVRNLTSGGHGKSQILTETTIAPVNDHYDDDHDDDHYDDDHYDDDDDDDHDDDHDDDDHDDDDHDDDNHHNPNNNVVSPPSVNPPPVNPPPTRPTRRDDDDDDDDDDDHDDNHDYGEL